MNKRADIAFVITLAGFAVLATAAADASATDEAAATALSGDRLALSGKQYCLFGIDAPEPGQQCKLKSGKPYNCGTIAKTALMDLILGATVHCTPVAQQDAKAACTVAKCAAGGADLSANMVHTGWALARPDARAVYGAIEAKAKQRKYGLWAGAFVPPWTWRQQAGKRPAR
ncbi:MAG: thermonuclease family protein [Alphaproteobacteria bacterium]|nr:thermonuclease family protein [Alphaproteobacteria bacterium]